MSKRASPTAIGAFVVGAVALIVVGVLFFGSGRFFRHPLRYALFFNTSVEGLSVGAPVQFRGVKIGQVSRIEARWGTQWIEVVIDVDPRALLVGQTHSVEELVQEIEKSIKDSGLRAQLRTLSLLTGQLFVAIDLFPKTESKLTGLDLFLPEIPVVPTTLQIFSQRAEQLMDTLASLPLPDLIKSTAKAVEGINTVVNSEDFHRVIPRLSSVLGHSDDIVRTLSGQEGPLLASAKETLDSTRAAVADVSRDARQLLARLDADAQTLNALLQDAQRMVQKSEGEIGSLGASIRGIAEEARAALEVTRRTLEKAQAALGAVDGTLGGTEPLGHQLINTLQDLAAAARSVQTLADYLDRHPEALLKGKGNPGGK
jgi:paraquat-inducible protein B